MNKVPKLRFRGFEGEWESTRIEELFEIRNGYTPSKAVKQYWEGGTIPWFRMEDIRENGGILADAIQHITPLGVKGTGLFEKNSIILATTATIGVHAMLIADSLANQQFTNFSIRKSLADKYDSKFVYYAFFGIDEWAKKNTNSGGLLAVNMPLLLKQPFYAPSLPEQQRIASYFTHLDTLIEASRKKVEKYKQVKAASLQTLFPKHGECGPKLRFKGCEGEWKKIAYADIFEIVSDRNHNVDSSKYQRFGKTPIIDQSKTFIVGYTDVVEPIKVAADGFIIFGDHTREWKYVDFDFCTGADGTQILKAKECFDSKFLFYECSSLDIPNTGYNRHLKYVKESHFLIPSLQEQHLIAQYFTHLDALLTLEQQRYEKLQQVKQASLSQMFVS